MVNEGRTTTGYPPSVSTPARQSSIEWQITERADSAPIDLHAPTGALPPPVRAYVAPPTRPPAYAPMTLRPPGSIEGLLQEGDVTSSIAK